MQEKGDSGFPLNVLKRIATNHLSGTARRKSSLQAQRPRVRIDPNEAIARFVRKKVFVSSRLKKSFLTAHRAIDKISQLKSSSVSQVFTFQLETFQMLIRVKIPICKVNKNAQRLNFFSFFLVSHIWKLRGNDIGCLGCMVRWSPFL